jgi:hypothetical protein
MLFQKNKILKFAVTTLFTDLLHGVGIDSAYYLRITVKGKAIPVTSHEGP